MAKQKTDRLTVSYDKDADVLYITEGKPREAIGEMMDDGIIVLAYDIDTKFLGTGLSRESKREKKRNIQLCHLI